MVVRRQVGAVLAVGIAAEDDDAARAAIRRVDWILRGRVKRAMEVALVDAALVCDEAGMAKPSIVHVMRVAALAVARRSVPRERVADVDGVAAAYASVTAPAVSSRPVVTAVVAVLVVALSVGGVVAVKRAMKTPSRTYARVLPPASAKAYVDGGAPLHDPEIDALLDGPLADLVVSIDRVRSGRGRGDGPSLDSLREPAPVVARGGELAAAWRTLIDVLGDVRADREEPREAEPHLRLAAKQLSDAFAAGGLGYYIEGRFSGSHAVVQSYQVELVGIVVANGAPHRVLEIRRLDHLNMRMALLGMHAEDSDPVLMMDQIDEEVASRLLPALGAELPYPLGDDRWMNTPASRAVVKAVTDAVHRELADALGEDMPAAIQIATLLRRRTDLLDHWRDAVRARGVTFGATEELFVSPTLVDSLGTLISSIDRERLDEIETELAELEAPRIAWRMHDLVAATVRRHEAQHGLDAERIALHQVEQRYPQLVENLVGRAADDDGKPIAFARAVRHELSAYLSQIANDPVTPQLALWNLARHAFAVHRHGTAESIVACVIIDGLVRNLHVQGGGPAIEYGHINRGELGKSAIVLASQPAPAVRAAASALWNELYGEPMTTIADR